MLSSLPRGLEECLPPILFVAVVCALGPWWDVYEFDTDEGFNLAKAVLVGRGYGLYDEIWSDQPPIFTYLLSGLFAIIGPSVAAARGLVLFFAALTVWALYRIVRRQEGVLSAWLAFAVLGSGYVFQRLGVSVMIGLPAIAFALLALDQALVERGGRIPRIVASGCLMGLALQTKLFTLAIVPAVLWAVYLAADGGWRARLGRMALWAAATIAIAALFLAISQPSLVADLVLPHSADALGSAFRYQTGWDRLWSLLSGEPVYPGLAAAALVVAWPWRNRYRSIPLIWLGVAALAFRNHTPVWYHHVLLFTIPLAWIAGSLAHVFDVGGVTETPLRHRMARGFALIAMVAAAPVAIQASGRTWQAFHAPADPLDVQGVSEIREYGKSAHWMMTDRPMDAFVAGIPIPPPLAVYSLKREKSGNLSSADILAAINEFQPEIVSSRRLRLPRPVRHKLADGYTKIVDRDDHTLYVLRTRNEPGDPPSK